MKVKKTGMIRLAVAMLCAFYYLAGATGTVYAATAEQTENERGSEKTVKNGGGYVVTGQIPDTGYTAELYDATNGLPTSDANYVMCDSDGYIWIGGYSGVIRYDGDSFESLDKSLGFTSARGLFEDSRGRIWFGTNDNGVLVLDKGEVTAFTYKQGLPSSSIRSFEEDHEGNVFIGTTAGVCYIDTDMRLNTIDDERLKTSRVLRLDSDSNGTIYGQTKDGDVFSINDCKISDFYSSSKLGTEPIGSILADPNNPGKVYIGTVDGYIYYGEFGNDVEHMMRIETSPVTNIHWLSYACGRIWAASTTQFGYLDGQYHFRLVDRVPVNSGIEMITSDYQGNIWVASSTQGAMKVVAGNFRDIFDMANLPDEVVNVTHLYNGMLYMGTDNGLLILDDKYNPVENELTEYIGNSRVRCIDSDADGNLWVSVFTNDIGLVRQSAGGQIINFTKYKGLPSNEVRCTYIDDDGTVYVGTNGGLAVIEKTKVVKSINANDGIKNTVFMTLTVDDGKVYVGTDGDGVYIIDGSEISHISRDEGLSSDVVMRIQKDDENDLIWVITSNSIDYIKDGNVYNVSTIPYTYNYGIYPDKEGHNCILSANGLYVVGVDEMINNEITDHSLYSVENGLSGSPTTYSYAELDANGNLYIPTRSGVSWANIDHFYDTTGDIKLGVSSIYCDDNLLTQNDQGVYVIPAQTGRITITPAVLDYTLSNPTIRLYLEGGSDNGITVKKNKLSTLEYTGLKYGDYVLHIQTIDDKSGEVLQDAAFNITRKPRLYELLLSKILVGLLLVTLAGLIVWRFLSGTIIRRQYEEIRQARDEAQRANSAKSRFLANMSHEIRTPINTILGMDEMIMREDSTDVPKPYFMSIMNYAFDIKSASDSLLGLVNDLLDMSKIESGKMNVVEQEYDVADLFRSIISMIRVRAEEKDLFFDIDIDEMIPVSLYGDAGKIKQVLLNLLTNAVKYTDAGGFTLRVLMEERTNDTCKIRYSVKDTGIGVKPEDLDKLFTAYERLDEEKNSAIQGTGLGLDISRRFAELMNGTLRCESVYGKGSEFILTLEQKIVNNKPMGEFVEHVEDTLAGPYVPQFVAPDADVLVVDDNPMNLAVIKGLLKATKVFVTTADSGPECIEKVKYGSYDIVFLDHMMPGMDGIETLENIREFAPDLPVYALTANTTAGEEFYKSKGFNGYLAKPIDSLTLEKTILKHLPENIVMKPEEYSGENELKEIPEDMAWIKKTEGINVDEGIKNSGGISSYLFSLNLFNDTIDSNAGVIQKAYEEKDILLYTVKVHALKTSARIIGAMGLSELAEKLEEAGNKKDTAFIDENNPVLMKEYLGYKDKLARLHLNDEDDDKEMIDTAELKDAYNALKEVIPGMDYDAVEMILGELKAYRLPKEDAEKIERIEKLLKSFDWEKLETIADEEL
ncbi:MAG: response regulator [Lachnospiraceae bacterium]|nr:response regulator [Lachnospiraceae bacterium]